MQPFTDITVQPSYGSKSAIISWQLNSSYTGVVWVYRSPDGAGNWELLNTTAVDNASQYLDENLVVHVRHLIPHYRLVLEEGDGTTHDSPIVGLFERLTRQQYQGVSKMMKMEYLNMSRGNGIQVLHYKPLSAGTDAWTVDPITGATRGDASCPDDTSYGEAYDGGFRRPFLTWIMPKKSGKIAVNDREGGAGSVGEYEIDARFLAYPRPAPGDLIVHVPTDNRWSVESDIEPFNFRGLMPVAFEAKLKLLPRNDPRYRVPLPETLPPEMTRP